jgi:crossover junction endodeoxyribonuclease RuvC
MSIRILGIDPGFGRVGYGVIEKVGKTNTWKAVAYGCIETSPKKKFVERLSDVREDLLEVIKRFKPTRMAVEELFFFKNVTTGIEVSQARGVILLTGYEAGLPIDEFTPLEVKRALTGYGRAEKPQMQRLIAVSLGIKGKIKSDDAADALAIALTSGQQLWTTNL